ncbi:MAG: hypothetical protein OXF41_13165 [bacterium]|nr:hypothetical protein [bacterium]
MKKRLVIEAGLVVALVVAAVMVSSATAPVGGPDMSASDVCGSSERFVVESNYIGCTRGGTVPWSGGGSTHGIDERGRAVVYYSTGDDSWWERIKCTVGAGSCSIWVGELTPEEVAEARRYFGLPSG